jgi:tetratricopeptide (TPR) repeat protein
LAYEAVNNFETAETIYKQVLTVNPSHSDTLVALAKIHTLNNQNTEARMVLELALSLDASNEEALLYQALLLVKDGDGFEAEGRLAQLLAQSNPTKTVLNLKALALHQQPNRLEDANHSLQKALALDPAQLDGTTTALAEAVTLAFNLACINQAQGHYTKSLLSLNDCLEQLAASPDSVEASAYLQAVQADALGLKAYVDSIITLSPDSDAQTIEITLKNKLDGWFSPNQPPTPITDAQEAQLAEEATLPHSLQSNATPNPEPYPKAEASIIEALPTIENKPKKQPKASKTPKEDKAPSSGGSSSKKVSASPKKSDKKSTKQPASTETKPKRTKKAPTNTLSTEALQD